MEKVTGGGAARRNWLLTVIAVILAAAALKAAEVVFVPLIFTLLIVLLVAPFQAMLDRLLKGRLRFISLTVSMLLILLAIGLFVGAFWISAVVLSDRLPAYADTLSSYWNGIRTFAGEYSIPLPWAGGGRDAGRRVLGFLTAVVASLTSFISILALVLFLVLLLLIELERWRTKIRAAFSDEEERKVLDTVSGIAYKVRRFLLIRTLMSTIQGAAVWGLLAAMGVGPAFVWGFLAFLFNFLPYVGVLLMVIPPALIALVVYGWRQAFLVLAGVTVVNMVIGNYLSPRFEGRAVTVSPFVLLFSIVFWSWMWGLAGTVLAVPLGIAVAVAAENVAALRPIAVLMRNKAKK